MLKMFHDLVEPASSVAFWERVWREGDYAESLRFCAADPLRAMFHRRVAPGSVMLEGGCGRGAYVVHYTEMGVTTVGLDFATSTLTDVRRHFPGLLLGAADVARLPFRDGAVDTYYSGGVVEHFESGPFDAIAEARRVLRPGGALLISVPYFSPLRRLLAPLHRHGWQRTDVHLAEPPPKGRVFFQYVYHPDEFRGILAAHGFDVVYRQGYSILWGLYELPFLGTLLRRLGQRGGPGPRARATARSTALDATPGDTDCNRGGDRSPGAVLLKRLVVSEDDTIPVLGWAVRAVRWLAANMMMYECVPRMREPVEHDDDPER